MPAINLLNQESGQTVMRPVIYGIIAQIKKVTMMGECDILFNGADDSAITKGSIHGGQDKTAKFVSSDTVIINVTEDYNQDFLNITDIIGNERDCIFYDDELKAYVTPTSVPMAVEISFVMKSLSKSKIKHWRDEARFRLYSLDDVLTHDVTYSYKPNPLISTILKEIYDRRIVDGQSFQEYFSRRSSENITLVSDVSGGNQSLVVADSQARIFGYFDFDSVPNQADYDKETGMWTMSFTYKFTYDKPISCIVRYPVMVHNTLMPLELCDKEYREDLFYKSKEITRSNRGLYEYEAGTIINSINNRDSCLTIPHYDDFIPSSVTPYTCSVFYALCQLENENKNLFNLNELGDICIDEDILTFIRESEFPFITKPYQSPLLLTIYKDQTLYTNALTCDASGDVSSLSVLDKRDIHRVRLSVLVDYTFLSAEAIARLLKYPKALLKLISSVNDYIRMNRSFQDLANVKKLDMWQFNPMYGAMTGLNTPAYNGSSGWVGGRVISNSSQIQNSVIEDARIRMRSRKTVFYAGIIAEKAPSK